MDYSVRQLVDGVNTGEIRIPAFQRGFVWDADKVAFLMDSIYKEYPFGSLLLWQTRSQLQHDRNLGPFALPEPRAEYPIFYVLDGQQRISAIYGAFQHNMPAGEEFDPFRIHFDFRANPNVQEPQLIAARPGENDPTRHFPLNVLFDTVAYRRATDSLGDAEKARIDAFQRIFQEAKIPVQVFRTDERSRVAVVFERINRMGVALDTLQLLNAWTWSDEFDLQSQFESLSETLADFGFSDVGADADLVLRCCAAVLSGRSSAEALVDLNGALLRQRFDEVSTGIQGAIDFLRANLHVRKLENLPYETLLVPLCVFFAAPPGQQVTITASQTTTILRWIWRTLFTRRYSAGVQRNIDKDIAEMVKLKDGADSELGSFLANIDSTYFMSPFALSSVNTRTFILMLTQAHPLNFVSGQRVAVGDVLQTYNKREFHHLFPVKYLRAWNWPSRAVNCLANRVILSRTDNNLLGGVAPSEYRRQMPENVTAILAHALCPESLFSHDGSNLPQFLDERARLLVGKARELIA